VNKVVGNVTSIAILPCVFRLFSSLQCKETIHHDLLHTINRHIVCDNIGSYDFAQQVLEEVQTPLQLSFLTLTINKFHS
jgi:hypothetical protein